MKPKFPLTVQFYETGEKLKVEDEQDAACNLEWFDSDDPEELARVVDSEGRGVTLKVEKLEVVVCHLKRKS